MSTFVYCAYGAVFESEISCPDLPLSSEAPDVYIRNGAVPFHLPVTPTVSGAMFEGAPGDFLLTIDSVARYWIRQGREIIVDRTQSAADDDVRAFLWTAAIGVLLHQRGVLPLHAAAIGTEDGCVLIAGHSGDGKSTLAAALLARGYSILTDDLAAVTLNQDGQLIVHDGLGRLKLWADALALLGLRPDGLPRVRPSVNRYALRTTGSSPTVQNHQLKAVYVLQRRSVPQPAIEPVTGSSRFNLVRVHTYARRSLEAQGAPEDYFRLATAVATSVPFHRIARPAVGDSVAMLADLVDGSVR